MVSQIEASIRVSRPYWGEQDVVGDDIRRHSYLKATQLCNLLGEINPVMAEQLKTKANTAYIPPYYMH